MATVFLESEKWYTYPEPPIFPWEKEWVKNYTPRPRREEEKPTLDEILGLVWRREWKE